MMEHRIDFPAAGPASGDAPKEPDIGLRGSIRGHRLDPIFHARSVALVGLSSDPRKMTGAPLGILRQSGFTGAIFPVNPRAEEIGGLRSYPSIAALPETPEIALIMLAAKHCAQAIRDCAAKGIRAAVVLSSGFEESREGARDAHDLAVAAKETGLVVVGPNCEGIWSVRDRLLLTFGSAAKRDTLHHSPIAIISQSGAIAGAVARHLQNDAVGCAYVVSVGNETVLTIADYLEWMIEQDDVRVVLLFIEGLRDGERLIGLIRKATRCGIRVAALKSGNSAAGIKAALSHTGKIATDYAVYRDLLTEAGAIPIQSLTELIAAGEVLSIAPLPVKFPPRSQKEADGADGVSVFSIPGGTRALAADQCEMHGVPLAKFARGTVEALKAALPEFGSVENPTDLTGQVLSQHGLFDHSLSIISHDPHTEALIIQVANRGPSDVMARVALLGEVATKTSAPVIVTFLGDSLPAAKRAELRNVGVLCARDPAEAALFLGWLYRAREAMLDASPSTGASHSIPLRPSGAREAPGNTWPEVAAWLGAAGIAMPSWRILGSEDSAQAACAGLVAPLAVKALPGDAAHKSELGLLALNLLSAAEVEREAARLRSILGRAEAQILVQEMVGDGIEVLLAAVRNADFGPVLAIGMGGTTVELFRDVAWLALPTDSRRVRSALSHLKLDQLLRGFRGKPPADVDALVEAAVNLGNLFIASAPAIEEIEINPLFVRAAGLGVLAVDALVRSSLP